MFIVGSLSRVKLLLFELLVSQHSCPLDLWEECALSEDGAHWWGAVGMRLYYPFSLS